MLEPRSDRPTFSTPPYLPDSDDWFALEDWVGADRPSRRDDVAKVEALLAASGDLSFERTQGPTGYWGLTQDAALRRYQKRHGLVPDARCAPAARRSRTWARATARCSWGKRRRPPPTSTPITTRWRAATRR
jgi:hypothetical protein